MSEYPAMCKMKRFPIGAQKRIKRDFGPVGDYFGLIKCEIRPPGNLDLPVLPLRHKGKLVYVLYPKCIDIVANSPCEHDNDERVIRGTWCSMEVQKAFERGYELVKLEEVWHWPESKEGLFADYINLFLKIRTKASGYPPDCVSGAHQDAYIREFYEVEGIKLDKDKITFNAGLRALAK